jgi:serine protease Do
MSSRQPFAITLNKSGPGISKGTGNDRHTLKLGNMKKSLLILGLCGSITFAPAPVRAADNDSPIAIAKKLNQAFVQVVQKVSPSVVVVKVKQKVDLESRKRALGNNPFFEYFDDDMKEQLRRRMERMEKAPAPQGQGSGVIIRKDGYIVTNRHVVEDAAEIEIQMQDGRQYDAKVQGLDPQSDLAVLKIEADGLPAARFADSDKSHVGEWAIAIGAPFELDYSVTIGHISAKGRAIYASREQTEADFIQTDASINPGNSGGPLVNIDGEVVGINTMIRGIGTGIGFAIPSNLAREITDSLVTYGKVTRAWLGIGINSLREDPSLRQFYPKAKEGVVITDILRDGPAAESDLETRDLITAVEGKTVATIQQLKNEIRSKKIGSPLALTVNRNGKPLKVNVKPGKRPEPSELYGGLRTPRDNGPSPEKELGIKVEQVSGRQAQKLGAKGDSAVVIAEVEEDSIAAENGLSAGDVITNINGSKVATIKELRDALADADFDDGVSVQFMSDGGSRFRVLRKR